MTYLVHLGEITGHGSSSPSFLLKVCPPTCIYYLRLSTASRQESETFSFWARLALPALYPESGSPT